MPVITPRARLGLILSSGNQTIEHYARYFLPNDIALHVTRMEMGGGASSIPDDVIKNAVECAKLLKDARVDVIGFQATGLLMARGPEYEKRAVDAIANVASTIAFTASQAAAEALRYCEVERLVLINPLKAEHAAMEAAYFSDLGFTVTEVLSLGGDVQSSEVAPNEWRRLAQRSRPNTFDGIFLSGSNTRMIEALTPIEASIGKPAITSIQASLWCALRKLPEGLKGVKHSGELGHLFEGPG